jgi:deoxycytidylate deaminase
MSSCWNDTSPKSCNDRQNYFLQCAAKVAQKSVMDHKHGAIIVLDNTVIATGFNYLYEHMCHKKSIHAEVDALLNVKGRRRNMLNDAEMYVVRIGTKNMDCPLKYSRPCCDCQKAITKYGIRKVYYSTSCEYNQIIEKLTE